MFITGMHYLECGICPARRTYKYSACLVSGPTTAGCKDVEVLSLKRIQVETLTPKFVRLE